MELTARYLLCPGPVRSRTDGDVHHVSAPALARLYGVPLADCAVLPPGLDHASAVSRSDLLDRLGRGELVALQPRYDGDYRLPGGAA